MSAAGRLPNDRELLEGRFYILDGTHPVPVDLLTWGRWFATADRHVAHTVLPDGTRVSTVFLGLDHQWGQGPPLLFETMVFGPDGDEQDCGRWRTWHQAEQGHAAVVERLQALPGRDGGRNDDA